MFQNVGFFQVPKRKDNVPPSKPGLYRGAGVRIIGAGFQQMCRWVFFNTRPWGGDYPLVNVQKAIENGHL